jgi:undecaprenyl-diphosphatase
LDLLKSVTLGVVQGLTEFLPISSTAHLALVPRLLKWPDPGAAGTAVMQLGTMAAVVAYFRKDLREMSGAFLRSLRPGADRSSVPARLGWAVVVGTIPISVLGLALKGQIETSFRGSYVIGGALIGMAVLLWLAEAVAKHRRGIEDVQIRDGWLVGLAQAVALVPGASRSGSTLTGALLAGMTREAAARFSFLLSVPAVVLSGLFEMKDVLKPPPTPAGAPAIMVWSVPDVLVATVVSGVVGYASIAFLLRYLRTHTTLVFIVYRLLLGAVILYLASRGFIS